MSVVDAAAALPRLTPAEEAAPFRWGAYVDPLECDLCWAWSSGCPFHPDNDWAERLAEGLRRWAVALLWDAHRRFQP